MVRRVLLLLSLVPLLSGFEVSRAREALDRAFHNLYGPDVLAALEIEVEHGQHSSTWTSFAYGRKQTEGGTRTLLYSPDGGRHPQRALLVQQPGESDRIFVSEGRRGQVRPIAASDHAWSLFGTHFTYEDFRTHSADDYRIEVLGTDRIQGEHTRVLRLRPFTGPYSVMLMWLSTERPVILRVDYFDRKGLWKRYVAHVDRLVRHFDWWVPMEDEMIDLRTGERSTRRVVNIMVDAQLGDEVFSIRQLVRGNVPRF